MIAFRLALGSYQLLLAVPSTILERFFALVFFIYYFFLQRTCQLGLFLCRVTVVKVALPSVSRSFLSGRIESAPRALILLSLLAMARCNDAGGENTGANTSAESILMAGAYGTSAPGPCRSSKDRP